MEIEACDGIWTTKALILRNSHGCFANEYNIVFQKFDMFTAETFDVEMLLSYFLSAFASHPSLPNAIQLLTKTDIYV